nr:tetratricopeptide repeat protein 28-like [Pocillopora verrucosa]
MAESSLPATGEKLEVKNEFPATATEESQVTSSDAELDVYNDPLRGIAKVCLEEGNKEYRQGEANNAINSYTEGLHVNCKDKRLNAKLYSNRATAHFRLANYMECLDDATVAVQLEPTFIKAIKKGARACVELCWYKEARSWLHMGLTIDNNNERLLQLKRKSNTELKVKANTYASLGCTYHNAAQFDTAIDGRQGQRRVKQSRQVMETISATLIKGDKAGEGASYCNLGNAYQGLGEFKTAIKYHQRDLEIAKEVGDKAGEGASYGNLGNAYDSLGEFKTAIKYHQRDLEIAKEVGDKAGEGKSYGNLGNAYQGLGEFKTAIKYHQRHLEIAKEVGDKAGEGRSYGSLGNAYCSLGEFKTAIKYHQRHLEIAKEVGDKAGEGKSYGSLGNAYQGLGEFKTAIKYHQRDLEIAKEVGDKAGEGRSYGNLGNAYQGLGEFKTAIKYHQRHLEIAKEAEDKAGEGRSYGNLGNAYCSLGEFKTAIKYHQRHLEIAKEVGDKAGEGRSYCNLGIAYCSLGEFKTAIKYHQRDLEIAKEVGDKVGEGKSYGNLGNAYQGLGEFKTAIKYHQRHLEIAKEVGDKAGEGTSYGNLGNAYQGLGQFKTAIQYHQRHLEIAKEVGDKAGEGKSYGNLGNAYQGLGQFKTAIQYHQRHLEIAKEVGDKAGEGTSYGNLGNAYQGLGQFKTAIQYHQRHLEIAKEVGDKAGEGSSYGNLGNAYQGLGQFKTAIQYHQRHLEIAKEVGDRAGEGSSYGSLGNAYQSLRQFKTATEYHQRHLEIAKEVGDKAGEGKSYCLLGRIHQGQRDFERQGNLMMAFDCYYSSVELYDDIRASLQLNDQWKICYRNQHQGAYKGLWRINVNRSQVVKALLATEKGRAQALRDLMVTKYQPGDSLTPSTSRTSLRLVPLSTVFIAINGPCVCFWVCLSENNIQTRVVHVNKYKYENELELFIQLLNKAVLKEISKRDTVTIENPPLDSPRTDEEVANDVIRVDVRHSQSSALKKLHDIIVTPIADLIEGNDEITIVPEGPFCLVPYAALQDSNSSYLSDSLRIRVLPSLTTLQLIHDCPADFHVKTGALLVGDPCFKHIIYEGTLLMQLPGARKEAEMIGRILNVSPLTGEMATKDEVLKRISSVALVHIGAHGKMETGEVILAPNTTRDSPQPLEKDYLLTMKDVIEAGLRARLVVLSCCHTARGEVMAEGVVGMARALLGAGARSVVVTLWAIGDEGTLEFMSFFYDALSKGKKASEALNQAMKCMREIEKFKEVIYWAPFVLIGDDVNLDFNEI